MADTGLACPECGSQESSVLNCRAHAAGRYRRRRCSNCAERFSTIEKAIGRAPINDDTRNNIEALREELILCLDAFMDSVNGP